MWWINLSLRKICNHNFSGVSERAQENTLNVLTSSDVKILHKMEMLPINFKSIHVLARQP